MATRVPAHRSHRPVRRTDDPHHVTPVDPDVADLLHRAAQLREQIRVEDDELGWGWAA